VAGGSEVRHLLSEASRRLEKAGADTPLMESQLLLGIVTGRSRLEILRDVDAAVTPEEAHKFDELVKRRVLREPLAYLRGTQEFYGLTFEVSPAVLVPRPETELLVDLAIEKLKNKPNLTLVDVGTGSGCIAVAAAVQLPHLRVIAVDISPEALKVAERNAISNAVRARIQFIQSDLLQDFSPESADMVVANPPYIPSNEVSLLQPEVRNFEPRLALDGGLDGFAIHYRLIKQAAIVLKQGGWLGIEVAIGQARKLSAKLRQDGWNKVQIIKDLAGIDRVVIGEKPDHNTA
jgi:release factor glutamine methyltransferase